MHKLTFRETGISKATRNRIIVLIFLFIAGVVFFEIVLNFKTEEEEEHITLPSLPVVTTDVMGEEMNRLRGYTKEMDALYMRDAVALLKEDRSLTIHINTYGRNVEAVAYDIQSMDAARKIADTVVEDYVQDDEGIITANLRIENLVEPGEEYIFRLVLTIDGEEVYYYTRILIPVDAHEEECLAFAKDFHEQALNGRDTEIAPYMETDPAEDKDDLNHVTIKSTLNQVCYGDFDGVPVGDPQIEIKDINDAYMALEMDFQMTRVNEHSQTEYYNVREYFKIRYAPEHMYLLDYDRTMEQMLGIKDPEVVDNIFNCGLIESDVDYLSNETGTIVSFVQAGELFQYNQNRRTLTKVFSFVTDDPTDPRAIDTEHEIKLLNIDETGAMDFVVYGYMNGGDHEGNCGIDLLHYDSSTGQTKEHTFIQTTNSFQILQASFSNLLFKSTGNVFYIMVDGTLISVDLLTMQKTEMLTGLKDGTFAASKGGRYVAWSADGIVTDVIHIMDLETGSKFDIRADEGEKLRTIAFMDEDLVYGFVKESDISTDAAGGAIYPMYRMDIIDITTDRGKVLKTYEKSGRYVSDARQNGYTLYLELAEREADGTFSESGTDTIKDSSGEKNKTVQVQLNYDDKKMNVVSFAMAPLDEENVSAVKVMTAGVVPATMGKIVTVDVTKTEQKYFVYVGSRVEYSGANIKKAITLADEEMGIVVDNTQQYIWKRGRAAYTDPFTNLTVGAADVDRDSVSQALSIMLAREGVNIDVHSLLEQGSMPTDILQGALKDATILDLTGCTLSETLYYVSQDAPVFALTPEGEAVLIVGYDASGIFVFDPLEGTTEKKGMTESTEEFELSGNVFISYVK